MKASFVSMFCLSFTANVNVAAHIVVHNARQCPARRNNRKPAKCGQDSMRIDPDARSMLDCSDVDSNDRPKARYMVVKTR